MEQTPGHPSSSRGFPPHHCRPRALLPRPVRELHLRAAPATCMASLPPGLSPNPGNTLRPFPYSLWQDCSRRTKRRRSGRRWGRRRRKGKEEEGEKGEGSRQGGVEGEAKQGGRPV